MTRIDKEELTERFGYIVETAPQREGKCEDSSGLSLDAPCQRAIHCRVVCFCVMSYQLGDASVPIWHASCQSCQAACMSELS